MPVIPYQVIPADPGSDNRGTMTIVWPNMANGDEGQPITLGAYTDRSVELDGTPGVGGNARIEGTNRGTVFKTLTDPQGNALDMTTLKIEQVSEVTRQIKPRITAGDGSTSLTVTLYAVRKG